MAKKADPNEIVHVQPKPGQVVRLGDHAYGDRGTVQVRRGDLDRLEGSFEEVDPLRLPDVGERPAAAA
jgi:hypothetical protein